jgi:hypothetical protein
LGTVRNRAAFAIAAGLEFGGWWFAVKAKLAGEDLTDSLGADVDLFADLPKCAALDHAQAEYLEVALSQRAGVPPGGRLQRSVMLLEYAEDIVDSGG